MLFQHPLGFRRVWLVAVLTRPPAFGIQSPFPGIRLLGGPHSPGLVFYAPGQGGARQVGRLAAVLVTRTFVTGHIQNPEL